MVTRSTQTEQRLPLTWRMVLSCALTILGLLAFTTFIIVHWTERQVLNVDAWTQTVGQLPKNDAVATSLSDYTIDQLLTSTELENRIEEALPDRAGFLAAPLTDQLETFLDKQTKNVIQSDQFESIWVSANKAVFNRVVGGARETTDSAPQEQARFVVPLETLRSGIRTILTNNGLVNEDAANKRSELIVELKTSVHNIQNYIRIVDFLYATVWLLAIVCFMGALLLSRNRRKLLIIIGISIIVISLLQLIGIRALRPAVLNFFADASAMEAAGVVYDTLLLSFRELILWVLGITTVIVIALYLTTPRILRKSKTISQWLDTVKTSSVSKYWKTFRTFITTYRWYITGIAALISLIVIAFFVPITWQSATLTVLTVILIAELAGLLSLNTTGGVPMKHTKKVS